MKKNKKNKEKYFNVKVQKKSKIVWHWTKKKVKKKKETHRKRREKRTALTFHSTLNSDELKKWQGDYFLHCSAEF